MASFIQGIVGVTSDDVIYVCLPLYHSSAFLMGLTAGIERGNDSHWTPHYCKIMLLSKTGLANHGSNSHSAVVTWKVPF